MLNVCHIPQAALGGAWRKERKFVDGVDGCWGLCRMKEESMQVEGVGRVFCARWGWGGFRNAPPFWSVGKRG